MRLRALLLAVAVLAPARASADPLRLRADALATTSSPVGLLVLESDGKLDPGLSAEAVVWVAGARTPGEDASGDVLVIAVRWHSPDGRQHLQLGRFVSSLGALRPAHVDGLGAHLRLPLGLDLDAVAGMPVPVTGGGNGRAWDWLVGVRAARRLGDYGSAGVAFAETRDGGRLVSRELGLDAGFALGRRDDLGLRAAYDLVGQGLAEVGLSASHRQGALRSELYARHRSASHLLPATSLFSVIGDVPSQRLGAVLTWRAAPRLELMGDLALRRIDDDTGEELVARARLRLDDSGQSSLGGELHRAGGGDFAWTGLRLAGRFALPAQLALSTEVELVIPDEDQGRGTVWPWMLAALSWRHGAWEAALAIEASASAEYAWRVDGLAQLSRRWELP